jgi:hypothetical protein
MNPLERHGLDHLSASSLNLWMANPREWAVRYLAQEVEEADPALWRLVRRETGSKVRVTRDDPVMTNPFASSTTPHNQSGLRR